MFKSILLSLFILILSLLSARQISGLIKAHSEKKQWERETTGLGEAEKAQNLSLQSDKAHTLIVGSSVSMLARDLGHSTRNLGFYASTPPLLQKLINNLETETLPYEAAAIEFLPQNLTKNALFHLREMTELRLALFLSYPEIMNQFIQEPFFFSEILSKKLLGISSPEINTNLLTHKLKVLFPTTEESIPALQERMLFDVKDQIKRFDLLDLHFSENSVKAFIDLILSVKNKSKCTILFFPPDNSSYWTRSLEGERRLEKVAEQIRQRTGLKIHHLTTYRNFTYEHFRNATHLNRKEGQILFNEALTELLRNECRKEVSP